MDINILAIKIFR